jgi:hypothetical protein
MLMLMDSAAKGVRAVAEIIMRADGGEALKRIVPNFGQIGSAVGAQGARGRFVGGKSFALAESQRLILKQYI